MSKHIDTKVQGHESPSLPLPPPPPLPQKRKWLTNIIHGNLYDICTGGCVVGIPIKVDRIFGATKDSPTILGMVH